MAPIDDKSQAKLQPDEYKSLHDQVAEIAKGDAKLGKFLMNLLHHFGRTNGIDHQSAVKEKANAN